MSVIKYKDKVDNEWKNVVVAKGDKGDSYTITEADYQAIADIVKKDYTDGDEEEY